MDTFANELAQIKRRDLRLFEWPLKSCTALNYHLSKYIHTVKPICPLCKAEEKTVSHLLGLSTMLAELRAEFFDTYYATVTDIIDKYIIDKL